jgi:hypothetical protein
MNEVSNFDTNQYSDKLQCPINEWDDPPYETSRKSAFKNSTIFLILYITHK